MDWSLSNIKEKAIESLGKMYSDGVTSPIHIESLMEEFVNKAWAAGVINCADALRSTKATGDMWIRKYWLNDEIYIYAIKNSEVRREEDPTIIDFFVGRKGYADILFTYGITEKVPEDLETYVKRLYADGVFDGEIDIIYTWS